MKYLQTGRSMLEMLAVLALMGLISFAGLVGYNEATVRNQAVNLGKDALLRATAVNALSQSYFVRRLSENAPISLSGFSNKIYDIAVSTKKETNASFIITYTDVPKRVCDRVIETNAIGLYKTTVNNVDLSLDNMTTICTGTANTISFSFYRAGYTSTRVEEADDPGSSPSVNPCAEIRCNGCQVCSNGVCVNDSPKCSGCQTCDGICIDDNSKCGSGTCVNGTCYCNNGYTGTYCDTVIDLCAGITCSGHGTCANGVCTCDTDYYGDDCSVLCGDGRTYKDGKCTCDTVFCLATQPCVNDETGETWTCPDSTLYCSVPSAGWGNTCCMWTLDSGWVCCDPAQIPVCLLDYGDGCERAVCRDEACTSISNCLLYNEDCTCSLCDSAYIPSDDKKTCVLAPDCSVLPDGSSCYVSPSIIGVCQNGGCLDPT